MGVCAGHGGCCHQRRLDGSRLCALTQRWRTCSRAPGRPRIGGWCVGELRRAGALRGARPVRAGRPRDGGGWESGAATTGKPRKRLPAERVCPAPPHRVPRMLRWSCCACARRLEGGGGRTGCFAAQGARMSALRTCRASEAGAGSSPPRGRSREARRALKTRWPAHGGVRARAASPARLAGRASPWARGGRHLKCWRSRDVDGSLPIATCSGRVGPRCGRPEELAS